MSFYQFYPSARVVDERGAILSLLTVLFPVLIALAGLLIENSRQQDFAVHVQVAADSCAMAAASSLDGSLDGWRLAKRACKQVLQTSNLPGLNADLDDLWFTSGGGTDGRDGDVQYEQIQAIAGNFTLTVERGGWIFDSTPSIRKKTFRSYESNSDNDIAPGSPGHFRANAVRAEITLSDVSRFIPISFSGGDNSSFGALTRESVAIADNRNDEACVVPIAIPLCALHYNYNRPNNPMDDEIDNSRQCTRTVNIHESSVVSGGERWEGINRADQYFVRYKFNGRLNSIQMAPLAFPIEGWLGEPVPDVGAASASTIANRLASTLNGPRGCVKAKIGQKFGPVTNPNDLLDGVYGGSSEDLRQAIFGLLTGPAKDPGSDGHTAVVQRSFNEAFCNGNGCASDLSPSFPYLSGQWADQEIEFRNADDELLHTANVHGPVRGGSADKRFPLDFTSDGDGIVFDHIYANDIPPYGARNRAGINPMCHDPLVGTSQNRNTAEVTVMVVAPSDPNKSLCDYETLIKLSELSSRTAIDAAGTPQINSPGVDGTETVVVGFSKIKIFDGRITQITPAEYANDIEEFDTLPGATEVPDYIEATNSDDIRNYLENVDDYLAELQTMRNECEGFVEVEYDPCGLRRAPCTCYNIRTADEHDNRACYPSSCIELDDGTTAEIEPGCLYPCPDSSIGLSCRPNPVPCTEPEEPEPLRYADLANPLDWRTRCFEFKNDCRFEAPEDRDMNEAEFLAALYEYQNCAAVSLEDGTLALPLLQRIPGTTCLPLRKTGHYATNDPRSYEGYGTAQPGPQDLRPGWGCAGVVAKPSCDTSGPLFTQNDPTTFVPALVD